MPWRLHRPFYAQVPSGTGSTHQSTNFALMPPLPPGRNFAGASAQLKKLCHGRVDGRAGTIGCLMQEKNQIKV